MNKTKLLIGLTLGLFLINLIVLWYSFSREAPPRRKEPKQIIIEKLQLNASQQKQYEVLIQEHRKQVRNIRHKLAQQKQELYSGLTVSDSLLTNDSLWTNITNVHRELEQIHYQHFLQIKQLCTTEQLPLFNALTPELVTLFAPPKPKHEPN
jgi:protein CpxP